LDAELTLEKAKRIMRQREAVHEQQMLLKGDSATKDDLVDSFGAKRVNNHTAGNNKNLHNTLIRKGLVAPSVLVVDKNHILEAPARPKQQFVIHVKSKATLVLSVLQKNRWLIFLHRKNSLKIIMIHSSWTLWVLEEIIMCGT